MENPISEKWFISGNTASHKNGYKITNRRLVKGQRSKDCFDLYVPQMWAIKIKFRNAIREEKPIYLHVKFYRKSKHAFDYINACQTLQDCMVLAGLIKDDNADELMPIFEPYVYSPDKAGVEIWIEYKKCAEDKTSAHTR